MYFSFPHSTTLNQCLLLFSYNEGAKNNKGEKTKSVKDPNSEPSSLFQREGVHILLGELSKKFPPQFLQQGQALPGKYLISILLKFNVSNHTILLSVCSK